MSRTLFDLGVYEDERAVLREALEAFVEGKRICLNAETFKHGESVLATEMRKESNCAMSLLIRLERA